MFIEEFTYEKNGKWRIGTKKRGDKMIEEREEEGYILVGPSLSSRAYLTMIAAPSAVVLAPFP